MASGNRRKQNKTVHEFSRDVLRLDIDQAVAMLQE